MKNKIYIIALILTGVVSSCSNSNIKTTTNTASDSIKQGSTQSAAVYQCPMDCEKGKTYSEPGKCPVCEMDLEKK